MGFSSTQQLLSLKEALQSYAQPIGFLLCSIIIIAEGSCTILCQTYQVTSQ